MNPTMYYFGCIRESGHYLWDEHCHSAGRAERSAIPWGDERDAGLCPKGHQHEGHAALHYKDGWTALAFWDRSVDHRTGSNSNFFAVGTYDAHTMLALVRERFPTIWKRFGFDVRVVEVSSPEPAKPFAVECSVCKRTGYGCDLWGWVHGPPGWFRDSLRPVGQAIGRWVCSVACAAAAPDPTQEEQRRGSS